MAKVNPIKFVSFDETTSEFIFETKKTQEQLVFVIVENDKPILDGIGIVQGFSEGHCLFELSKSKDHIFVYCVEEDKMEIQAVLAKK